MDAFQDKVIIITGAASGMGRELALQLGARGGRIVLADLDESGAEEAAGAIREASGTARAAALDVSDRQAVNGLVQGAFDEYGRLDYMFNNAGMLIGGEGHEMSDEQWDRILGVNYQGVLYGTLAAYRLMIRQASGHIVNTASTAGLAALPTAAAYTATKHAVVGLTNALRQEAVFHGVRMSVVCPGFVDTRIFKTGILVNGDMDKLIGSFPMKPIPSEKAARCIIRGVVKNKGMIVFPAHARIMWAIYRACPTFYGWGSRKVADDFHKMKTG